MGQLRSMNARGWAAIVTSVTMGMALLFSAAGPAEAHPYAQKGLINACVKTQGKNAGALRLVKQPRRCKRMRGWRRVSWSAHGSAGATGQPGAPGSAGQTGAAGQIEQSLLETIQTQTAQINALTQEVSALDSDLADLEGTVGDVCDQVGLLTDQSDEILASVAGISLNDTLLLLGGLLEVPALPAALGSFEC